MLFLNGPTALCNPRDGCLGLQPSSVLWSFAAIGVLAYGGHVTPVNKMYRRIIGSI